MSRVHARLEDPRLRLDVEPGGEDRARELRTIGPQLRNAILTTVAVFGTCEVEGLAVGPVASADERVMEEPAVLQARVEHIRQNYPEGVGPFRFVAGRLRTCSFRTRHLPADHYCEGLAFAHLADPDASEPLNFDKTVVLCLAHARLAVRLEGRGRFDHATVKAGHPPIPAPERRDSLPPGAAGNLEDVFGPAIENKET